MLIEQSAERLRHRERQMAIAHARMQHCLYRLDPALAIDFRTRQAELTLATEGHHPPLMTIGTHIDRVPVGWVTTAQHPLHHRIDGSIPRVDARELLPPVNEDLLEAVLLCLTSSCHGREDRPPASLCQISAGATGRKKEIPMGSSWAHGLADNRLFRNNRAGSFLNCITVRSWQMILPLKHDLCGRTE